MQPSLVRWEKPFTSQLLRLSIPIALQSVVTASMQIVDNLMIGVLGDVPLSAVTQANRVSFLFQVAMFGAISGSSIFVAQYWGRRDVAGVRRTQGIAMLAALVVSALLGLPSIFAPRGMMRLFLKSEEGVAMGAGYLAIMGFVYFIQAQSLIQAAVLKSTEQVKLPMFASFVAIGVNILFNWLLIYDHGSFGGYGVRGGAIATLIGAAAELFLLVFFARRFHFATAASPGELRPESFGAVRRFLRVALPVLINETLWACGTVTYSAVYGRIGDGVAASAAAGIFSNVEQLANITVRALCYSCGVMVGMALGAGETDRARLYAKRFLLATPLTTLALSLLVILPLSGPLVGIFPVAAETAHMARELILIYCMVSWLHAFNCVIIVAVLRTGGDVRTAAVIDVLPLWLAGVPIALVTGLVLKWELKYVYLSASLEQLVRAAVALWRYRQYKWVRNIVREDG